MFFRFFRAIQITSLHILQGYKNDLCMLFYTRLHVTIVRYAVSKT